MTSSQRRGGGIKRGREVLGKRLNEEEEKQALVKKNSWGNLRFALEDLERNEGKADPSKVRKKAYISRGGGGRKGGEGSRFVLGGAEGSKECRRIRGGGGRGGDIKRN